MHSVHLLTAVDNPSNPNYPGLMLKRNPLLIDFMHRLPERPFVLSGVLKKCFQVRLNHLLTHSMEQFNYPLFKLALCLGANPNIDAKIKKGYRLVTRCARSGEVMFLSSLLNFGGETQGVPGDYQPLHMSATKGMEGSIRVLLDHGADVDALYELPGLENGSAYPKGWSPLVCACIHKKTRAAQALLEAGANPFDINEKGVSVVDICLRQGNVELAQYILQKQKNQQEIHTLVGSPCQA